MKLAQETGDQEAYSKAIEMSEAMPKEADNRVHCPYCDRKFAQNVADRHIPRCRDIKNRPKPPPKQTNNLPKRNQEKLLTTSMSPDPVQRRRKMER